MYLLHAHLTCGFAMCYQAGKGVQQMGEFFKMHASMILQFRQAHTIWQMLDFPLVMCYWCHIEVSNITSKSGDKHLKGKIYC